MYNYTKYIMKRLLLILFLACSTLVNAQQHMKFMGIPMGTHINTFKQALANKGFKHGELSSVYNECLFWGSTFYNREVYLTVSVTPKTKKVHKILVVFNSFSYLTKKQIQAFNEAKSFYNDLATSLNKKYKKTASNSIDILELDKGWKGDTWSATGGDIALELHSMPLKYQITITYFDSSTFFLNKKEAESDL